MTSVAATAAAVVARRVHVALFRPQIPSNTGHVGRTVLGLDASLHLIKPLGFSLDDRDVRRAGLDYWDKLALTVHDDLASLDRALGPSASYYVLTRFGESSLFATDFCSATRGPICLVFGSERSGMRGAEFPACVLPRVRNVAIPMTSDIRCYNLSCSVSMALFEASRQIAASGARTASSVAQFND
eukprot:c5068_g1_i1.p1 GENE.c5068_g1_i1~~c5068_g1_i1.p1  ORF type:complete len:186 (+),score=15.69 c5068_g1_i1:102-659(+)